MKTNELSGIALDWAVAKCEELPIKLDPMGFKTGLNAGFWVWEESSFSRRALIGQGYSPSTLWAQGGPIIEREKITICQSHGYHATATIYKGGHVWIDAAGSTALEAAMRCFVASKLGDEIDIPSDLLEMLE